MPVTSLRRVGTGPALPPQTGDVPAGHHRQGVRALLFDRLVRRERCGEGSALADPRTVYDVEALRDSTIEQLGWLLNTRVPIDFHTLEARTDYGTRTTVDYGLPDLTVYPVGDTHARSRLHDHLSRTIALFEPRLRDPQVTLAPGDGRSHTLDLEVSGTVRIGMMVSPIRFRVPIDLDKATGNGAAGNGGAGHGG